jgi:hypothetical protein
MSKVYKPQWALETARIMILNLILLCINSGMNFPIEHIMNYLNLAWHSHIVALAWHSHIVAVIERPVPNYLNLAWHSHIVAVIERPVPWNPRCCFSMSE